MGNRYKIRTYQSGDQDGATVAGTIVLPIDRSFTIYAGTAQEAEQKLQKDVKHGKLSNGLVYQICPTFGNPELIRSVAAAIDGSFSRVFLDPAAGMYGEFRRIRLPKANEFPVQAPVVLEHELVHA